MPGPNSLTIEGRDGLLIPQVDILPEDDGGVAVGRFFRNLWRANGLPVYERDDYHNELVIDASADKPLVCVRGGYKHTPTEEVSAHLKRVRYGSGGMHDRPGISASDIIIGTEIHEILLPPARGTLKFEKFLRYYLERDAGHRRRPLVSMDRESENAWREEAEGKSPVERKEIFNRALAAQLNKFVELAS